MLLKFNATDIEIDHAIAQIKGLISQYPDYQILDDLIILFEDINWRTHLVACVILLLLDDVELYLELLWSRIKHGSWVAPQLVATALLIDRDFTAKAERLLEDSRTSDKSAISIAAIFDKLYPHQKLSPIQLKTISHAEERTARVEGIPLVSNRITTGWLSRVCSIMEIGNPLIKD
ncbi:MULTISPECIES: hypothetical protein [unclassified Roseofilum]|uniref:hypothetical protein n=1 Tax=unclassified Roseofilum TaxID=2620099 RepID=UPI001B08647F|nr:MULTISPECIES: hypothetical protein [unclassified Roseofilum]MBP0008114.1 hypothetical protein [Roseofilum sp. Belize Diploria]MBP0012207.1 hypothetical protein [Roseofilum sp. SID3]MBP0024794.1 hypothetical protein [Roseofilum sp. SID2]MBP0039001.1 hypothetical protein [Roseofilum sp. SID1]MBP0043654.1 hypothetical protein [Roseofilum sp. SBFL]